MRRLLFLVLTVGCHEAPTMPDAASPSDASPVGHASADVAAPGPPRFVGSYTATRGALFVPDGAAWQGVSLRPDDAGALGEGTLSFTLDDHTLTGELTGPLGPATLTGTASDGTLSFHVAPEQPGDLAFSGTGVGTLDGGTALGELHVSSWRANVLREATFQAHRPPP